MPLRTSLMRVQAKVNTLDSRLFLDYKKRGFRVIFLEGSIESKDLSPVFEPTSGFKMGYSSFRSMPTLGYATLDEDFVNVIARASYVAAGVPVAGKIDLFEIDPTRRDVIPPSANNPEWKFFLMPQANRRYTVV